VTPLVYFGEAAISAHTCDEWTSEFRRCFEGLDENRISSVVTLTCNNNPEHRSTRYEGFIEAWSDRDQKYLDEFISVHQNCPIFDHQLAFESTKGVVLDFEVEYQDKFGNRLSQFGSQSLTLGTANVHGVQFDFHRAGQALDGSIATEFLPFIADTFGENEKLFAERFYLSSTKTISFQSTLRFLLDDFRAKKMQYWGKSRSI
jgi:hypothetical protein